jgi:hypothetical protein
MNLRLFPFLQVFTAMPVVCFRGKRYLEWKRHQKTGSLKCTHHFGRKRFFMFGEQLILHESVTHSINLSLPPLASVLGAAAFAAGDRLLGTICFGSQNPPTPLTLARHCSMVTKPQFVPPPTLSMAHHLLGSAVAVSTNSDATVSRQLVQNDNLMGTL